MGKDQGVVGDALERARFSIKIEGHDPQPYSSGKIVSATKFLKDPEVRQEAIDKLIASLSISITFFRGYLYSTQKGY